MLDTAARVVRATRPPLPSRARIALCNRMGLRPTRADPAELDATLVAITAPILAEVLRELALTVDSPGDLARAATALDADCAEVWRILDHEGHYGAERGAP